MYKTSIGLEVHVQLKTHSKMFCSCSNSPNTGEPNIHICPVCLGHPGTLPVPNEEAIKKVLRVGKALSCKLRDVSNFDRKNYFYPDLPKGYQISQDKKPFCYDGSLEIEGKKIHIRRIHLEEDTARLLHDDNENHSLVDFNRAGIPLMELVTEPDISSGLEARKFSEELRLIFRYLGVSDANMQQGQMRIEVNISLSDTEEKMGTKVEIKNLNSFRSVEKAVDYERNRQKNVLNKGEKVVQETRGWNDIEEKTSSQRSKEEAHDYRYFPEPDLSPIYLDKPPFNKDNISLQTELPQKKRERFKKEYGVDNKQELEVFILDQDLGIYFENVISETLNWIKEKDEKNDIEKDEKSELVHIVKSYILTDLLGILKGAPIKSTSITPENFAELITLIYKKEISSKIAKKLLKEMHKTGGDPSQIIKEKGLGQVEDRGEIEAVVLQVIKENEDAAEDYRSGKKEALQFLIGKVMEKTKGKAEPERTREAIVKTLQK